MESAGDGGGGDPGNALRGESVTMAQRIPKPYHSPASKTIIVMPTLMTARCTQCGHENNPEYRFCGVCGAPLPAGVSTREPAREQERPRVSSVGGPSFLGLGDDRTNDLDYLLEDEPPRGHGRMYLALLLLVLSAGLLAWHWQRDGYPWAGLAQSAVTGKAPASSSSEPGRVAAAPPPAVATPTPAETPSATGATTEPATGTGVQPAAGAPPAENSASPNPIAVVKAPEEAPPPADGVDPGNAAAKPGAAAAQNQGVDATDAAESSVPKETPAAPVVPATPVRKPAVVQAFANNSHCQPGRPAGGRGRKISLRTWSSGRLRAGAEELMIGARQSNPKAQTLLGAMYATGHCVNRDLPIAYRWFAKALHGDPGNSRVQRDLEVLWKQMTPEERQLAMKDR